MTSEIPTTLLAELTHRCPLHCPYCSNPIDMIRAERELGTEHWLRVLTEAKALGVLQLGLSGGEPMIRKDLEEIARHARSLDLYTTLVTSGLGLTRPRAEALKAAGLEHIQISVQDTDEASAANIAGIRGMPQKLAAAALVKELEFAFSINVVLHRANLDRIGALIDLAAELGADRIELANTQYYGWALKNRDKLMPTRAQVEASIPVVEERKARYKGQLQITYVLPDYFEAFPKPCYGGWGKLYLVVAPDGKVLPCHGATNIPSLQFDNVKDRSLEWIWQHSAAFNAYRGDSWMQSPCRSCEFKARDFGGCRCQAMALLGDAAATDPVCTRSPHRHLIDAAIADHSAPFEYEYRWIAGEKDEVASPA